MATSTSMLLGIRPLPVIFYTKLLLACAYALDPQCNRQLMEYPWYSFWNIVLVDLIAGLPGYIVFPQFPVWIIPPDEDEEVEGESDIESDTAHEPDVDEEPYDPMPTTSPFPTSPTLLSTSSSPGKANKFKLPDFAVLGLSGDTAQVEGQSLLEALTRHRSRAIIDKILIPLIVEIKRDSEKNYFTVLLAQDDAIEQSNFIFASTHQRYVVAIAAAGAYWSWAVIRRPPHLPVTTAEEQDDPTYVPPSYDVPSNIWSNIYNFGSADSDGAFHNVFSRMVGLRKGRRINNQLHDGSKGSEDEDDTYDSEDGGDPASPSNSSQHSSDGSSAYNNYSDDSSDTNSSEDDSSDTSGEVDFEDRDRHDESEDDTETEDDTDTGDDTETEDDRPRFTTPVQYARQSYAPGPHTPPSESPDPLVDYSEVGPSRPPLPLQARTPAPKTPPRKSTVKRNRTTDSPREVIASAMPPADHVSPSSEPLRKRGKTLAVAALEAM